MLHTVRFLVPLEMTLGPTYPDKRPIHLPSLNIASLHFSSAKGKKSFPRRRESRISFWIPPYQVRGRLSRASLRPVEDPDAFSGNDAFFKPTSGTVKLRETKGFRPVHRWSWCPRSSASRRSSQTRTLPNSFFSSLMALPRWLTRFFSSGLISAKVFPKGG